AIRSGMEILLRKVNRKASRLDRIYLAGAFGCYIGIESGIAIGLFPDVPREKYVQAGNLAGTGAAMALLSKKAMEKMERGSREIIHVELAKESAFRDMFLEHMSLGGL
ncbi:MAG: ATP-binding protein, partial [Lachnospiraceae bacterium]|nr:ATP-binding protein [Lachnospiraceae bacterium]